MIGMVFAAFGSLWLRHNLRSIETARQQKVVARMAAASGNVTATFRDGVVDSLRIEIPRVSALYRSDVAPITELPDLNHLKIVTDTICPGALDVLAQCPQVKHVELVGLLNDHTLENLPTTAHATSLALTREANDSPTEGIRRIVGWNQLKRLTLQGIGPDPAILKMTALHPSVEELLIVGGDPSKRRTGLEQVDVTDLGSWPQLRSLELLRVEVVGHADRRTAKELKKLGIAHCRHHGNAVESLLLLPDLTSIRLWNAKVEERHVTAALSGPKLTEFHLLAPDLPPASLLLVARSETLQRLRVSINMVDSSLVDSVAACPSLRKVDFVNLSGESSLPSNSRIDAALTDIARILEERRGG